MPVPSDWIARSRLWLVLDQAAAAPRTLLEVAQLGLAGGVDVIVFRQRETQPEQVLELARPIRALCRERSTPFVLSHYPQLARELEPDALHLGIVDGPLGTIRKMTGQGMPLGYSAHAAYEANAKLDAGCSYCFLGPVFATSEKLKYGAPLGLEPLCALPAIQSRLVAIGGIGTTNLAAVLATGVTRIAVIGAIQRQADPQAAAAELKRRMTNA